jgi:general secretion pathway protein A
MKAKQQEHGLLAIYEKLGIHKEPFSNSPDPSFFYLTDVHKKALYRTEIEILLKRGISVIAGDIGNGKSTLCRKLIQNLKERPGIDLYLIMDPEFKSEDAFLAELMKAFGLKTRMTRLFRSLNMRYKDAIQSFLFERSVEMNKTVVVLIDEAQKMPVNSLELLRTLLNYETNDHKMLQIVLFGQLELLNTLEKMPNLLDRISYKCVLGRISQAEMRELILHRLMVAGCPNYNELFTNNAIRRIHMLSEGSPRQAMKFCHIALRELLISGQVKITPEMVDNLIPEERYVKAF